VSEHERVVFVTVQYRSAELTTALLRSIARLDDARRWHAVVVDNATTDESAAGLGPALAQLGERATLVRSADNLYYWGGAAYGLEQCYGDDPSWPDWVIVCNNDVELPDPRFLSTLLRQDVAAHGVIAPRIISVATGLDQNPHLRRRRGWVGRLKWKLYYTHYFVARTLLAINTVPYFVRLALRRTANRLRGQRERATERIYAPHGACVIFSRRFFEAGGRLDTGFRMYGEELTVAETAARLGLPVSYCPALEVWHQEHATLGTRLTRWKYGLESEAFEHIRSEYWESGERSRRGSVTSE
jgi:GT2 family glycosyltransferase